MGSFNHNKNKKAFIANNNHKIKSTKKKEKKLNIFKKVKKLKEITKKQTKKISNSSTKLISKLRPQTNKNNSLDVSNSSLESNGIIKHKMIDSDHYNLAP